MSSVEHGTGAPGSAGRGAGEGADPDGGPDGARVAARRDRGVRAAVEQGLLGPAGAIGGDLGEDGGGPGRDAGGGPPVCALLDVAGIRASAAALRAAFAEVTAPGTPVLHTFAVKATPLVPVLRLLDAAGIGAEVASPGELALARAAGVRADRIVLDSPAKTLAELREALALGIAVNADNPQELDRIDALMDTHAGGGRGAGLGAGAGGAPGAGAGSTLGLRINPQTGGGSIDATATATATSKFGVALRDEGARAWVVRAFLDRPWLTRLHTHSGSQGIPTALMTRGVRELYDLAEEINAAAGRRQVDTLDIGGGLPVNFASDEETPTYAEYARLLKETVPGLLDGRYGLVTEFGRSLLARHGTVLTRVEYAKSAGSRPIAVTHAGVQLATRTVYAPASWPLRVAAYDPAGRPKGGPAVAQDIAGPACFAGDLLAGNRPLPLLEQGDLVAALDTGAYCFTAHYAYNSLARPGVYGFTEAPGGGVRFATVRAPQTLAEIVAESGGAAPDALLDG
ncbi:type III PLP-dependent enzyme domain-containing protein [Streptomyces paludis]|uniref:Diaminopimelate decarboxylase n=1 Tax=Streptomyces paludis TaxID=2282738 RepID=A0A345HNF3_9ACTN|nr:diaminopimelate decarboxylase [Streptomyces paludis]AXG78227.1 diaminopimelate decarboxylase [Streptomyces paludis]